MLCAFQNPHVRMAWNTYMHVDCQNLIVNKAQYTRKREDTVFKTKYCSYTCTLILYIYSNGHQYATWQYEHMPHKSMVNRLIRTKLSAEAQWWIVGIDWNQNVLCSIPIFVGFHT